MWPPLQRRLRGILRALGQASFDPDYETLPLQFFAPMTRGAFARRPYDATVLRPGERELLVNPAAA